LVLALILVKEVPNGLPAARAIQVSVNSKYEENISAKDSANH